MGDGWQDLNLSSGMSLLDFRVDRGELTAGVVDFHLPIDSALGGVHVEGPRRGFLTQGGDVAEAATGHALARHGAEFVLGDVEPAPMLGGVAELDAANQLPGPFGFKGFVERSLRVLVERGSPSRTGRSGLPTTEPSRWPGISNWAYCHPWSLDIGDIPP